MAWQLLSLLILPTVAIALVALYISIKFHRNRRTQHELAAAIDKQLLIVDEHVKQLSVQRDTIQQLLKEQREEQHEYRTRFDTHQIKMMQLIQDSMQKNMAEVRVQMTNTLTQHGETIGKQVDKLTQETQERLKTISEEVDKQLTKGFEKTTATFTDVVKRLAIIDEAQKKITELSGNVVDLQAVLTDKQSRGAFGEMQLADLVHNMIPEKHFSLQHTLANGKRADCVLFLPEPTGIIAIDAKFPLESYRTMTNIKESEQRRTQAKQQFRADVQRHIQAISEKYIINGETSDGAMMFIPAEAVFAEIHAHYPELVESAQRARVWLVSPTTMMAVLTTARAVLKDAATRKQVHIIQEHLVALGKDFDRFQARMDNLARHIGQAHQDVEDVHKSSRKITNRFNKIEKVEISDDNAKALLED